MSAEGCRMAEPKGEMTLSEWVTLVGDVYVAYQTETPESTVRSWRMGRAKPRPEKAKALIRLSGGQLGWEDIYGCAMCEEED